VSAEVVEMMKCLCSFNVSRHIASSTRTGRPIGSIKYSQTHAILEVPAQRSKIFWDLNMSGTSISERGFICHLFVTTSVAERERERERRFED
jgi:hypothetical protein